MSDGARIYIETQLEGTFHGRDAKIFHVMGQRSTFVDAVAYHDISEYLGVAGAYTFTNLTGSENFEIVSSAAADSAAGTGTRTVDICYVNTSYAITCTTVTMNGITPVAVGVLGALMILWMEAASGGSGEVSAGNISLRISGGGATHEYIKAGGNKSLSARFMVPDGYVALVPIWDTNSIRQAADFRLRATVKTIDRSLGTRYLFQDNAWISADGHADHDLPWLRFPARSKIKVSAIPNSVTQARCDVSFSIVLVAGP
jgi:hypothetical protein